MIHAICNFCGKDCGRTATLLTLTSFQNFARYSGDTKPFGAESEPRSYVICYDCIKKHQLPAASACQPDQKLSYDHPLDKQPQKPVTHDTDMADPYD